MSTARSPALRALSHTIYTCPRRPTTRRRLPSICPRAARTINTTSTLVENDALPHDLLTTPPQQEITSTPQPPTSRIPTTKTRDIVHRKAFSPRYSLSRTPSIPPSVSENRPATTTATATATTPPTALVSAPPTPSPLRKPLVLPPSVLQNLPHLASQPPYYINIHIHGRPYLVTAGDTLRLPFLMHGVLPGDILRLDRASALGSRDWTLKAGLSPLDNDNNVAEDVVSLSPVDITEHVREEEAEVDTSETADAMGLAPRTIYPPHRKPRFRQAYLDDRLFVCRAVVLGTESEPMRVKEKTKRRQRRVKKVKSKHRFTMLRIGEVKLEKIETGKNIGGEEAV